MMQSLVENVTAENISKFAWEEAQLTAYMCSESICRLGFDGVRCMLTVYDVRCDCR